MKSLSVEPPHAMVMVGIPGSGKTFFAKKFSDTFQAPYIEQAALEQYVKSPSDVDHLVSHILTETCKTKKSIVIEIDSASRARRNDISRFLKNLGYHPLFIWVQIDEQTARLRSKKERQMPADEHALRIKRFSPPHPLEKALVISGKHTYSSQARIVLKKLSGERARSATPPDRPVRGNIIVR